MLRRAARAAAPAVAALAAFAAAPGLVADGTGLIAPSHAQSKAKSQAPKGPTITPDEATNFIREMGNRTVSVLSQQGDAKARNDAFTAIMLEAMDFEAMALQTLGKMARTVTPKDKQEFTQLFAAYVIDVAIEKFGSTKVNSFAIGQLKPQPNGDIKVNTAVSTAEKPLNVDWRLHNKTGKPSINDVEVDGYSLVIHYRGEFERAGVSNVPGLIGKLKSLTSNSTALPVVRTAMK
jgi:phospholipid transport system substrate-binding protein